jgi:hypothetical protein
MRGPIPDPIIHTRTLHAHSESTILQFSRSLKLRLESALMVAIFELAFQGLGEGRGWCFFQGLSHEAGGRSNTYSQTPILIEPQPKSSAFWMHILQW